MNNRVGITGIGVFAANGNGVDAYWDSLIVGESGIAPITLFDATDLECRIAGEVKDFNALDYIDPTLKPRRMGRFAQLATSAAQLAIEDADLTPADFASHPEIPVVLGVSTTAMDMVDRRPSPFSAVGAIPHAAASAVGYMHDISTNLLTISNGCASSLDAVANAAHRIRSGHVDLAIAGGSDSSITERVVVNMLKTRRCSMKNEDPGRASSPFDIDRDRGVIAEGSGVLILENLDHARARGVTPYAEVLGYASCADPKQGDDGSGLGKVMRMAVANTGLDVHHIDHISAHGPSDLEMDIVEVDEIKSVFGSLAYSIPVSSVKGCTGCPMGAGGVLQLIGACLSLHHQMIPPTANLRTPDPRCDLDLPSRARLAQLERVIVNTHGFGRGNGCMVVEHVNGQ